MLDPLVDKVRAAQLLHGLVQSMLRRVSLFNEGVTGIVPPDEPALPRRERVEWAATALREEVDEFVKAWEEGDLPGAVDALLDMVYFALGRLHEMGVAAVVGAAFDQIHEANMKKVRGELSKRPGSLGHDAVKPEGWAAPDHAWLTASDLHRILRFWERLGPTVRRALELEEAKREDYGSLDDYFPFGVASYAQMVWMKAMRIRSVVRLTMRGGRPNFESLRDSAMDLLNYSRFMGDWLEQQEGGTP